MKIESSIEIQAPVTKVFSVFSDLGSLEDHLSGVIKLEVLEGPTQMTVGTKWRETRKFMGKEATEVMWVTALTSNRTYVVEAESYGTKYKSEYLFESIADGTKVTFEFRATPETMKAKIGYFIGFLFSGSLKKLLHQDLEDLKKICEEK